MDSQEGRGMVSFTLTQGVGVSRVGEALPAGPCCLNMPSSFQHFSAVPISSSEQDSGLLVAGDSCHTGRWPRWSGRFADGRVVGSVRFPED